jgi:ATP-dependent exoDNAse (exonuclease V) alpha subunit
MLKLKVGAQVMFVKNDPSYEKNYFNGKTGVIKSLFRRRDPRAFSPKKTVRSRSNVTNGRTSAIA